MEAVDQQPQTDRPWLFKPGQSGNPSGRRRKTAADRAVEKATKDTLSRLLEQRLGVALKVIDRTLKDPDNAVAFRAAVDLLDRVGGRAVAQVELNATFSAVDVITPQMLKQAALQLAAAQATDAKEPA